MSEGQPTPPETMFDQTQRGPDNATFDYHIQFAEAGLALAFPPEGSPGLEDEFYLMFNKHAWDSLPHSEKLSTLASVAKAIESAPTGATSLNLKADPPVPKSGRK
jgi:hypothetical protein